MGKLLKKGSCAKVISISHDHVASKRLIEMGITPNTVVCVENIAPLGDPYILKVRNYLLAVRKKDLAAIIFENVI